MELRVARKFRVGPKIGSGSFGEIYAGTPAKKIKTIAPNTDLKALANQYIKYTDWYK